MPKPEVNWSINIWSILVSLGSMCVAIFAAGGLWMGLSRDVSQQKADTAALREYLNEQLSDVRSDLSDVRVNARANSDRLNKNDVAAAQLGQRLEGFETLLKEVRDELRAFNSRAGR